MRPNVGRDVDFVRFQGEEELLARASCVLWPFPTVCARLALMTKPRSTALLFSTEHSAVAAAAAWHNIIINSNQPSRTKVTGTTSEEDLCFCYKSKFAELIHTR
jgi:hypothetical protein